MPSVDHCQSKTLEMTTLSNSIEVFDTYKHREDKDSDEESFHLPLDDDESDSKYQDAVIKNGNSNESEDEILNKFESAASVSEPIDSHLEERLLNDEEEDEIDKNGIQENKIHESTENEANTCNNESEKEESIEKSDNISRHNKEDCSFEVSNQKELFTIESKIEETNGTISKIATINNCVEVTTKVSSFGDEANKSESVVDNDAAAHQTANVPLVDTPDILDSVLVPEKIRIEESLREQKNTDIDKCNGNTSVDNSKNNLHENSFPEISKSVSSVDNKSKIDETSVSQSKCESTNAPFLMNDERDRCEVSNDSPKSNNEDSEDLFDISIIRDAAEDNAESAYNEAHPEDGNIEDSEEYEDRNDDKGEDDCNIDTVSHLEEDEEDDIDIDKNEDQLKNDDVDIEETKLDCDGIKEPSSDGESDGGNKTDFVRIIKTNQDNSAAYSAKDSTSDCRLDEVTGNLTNSDGVQTNSSHQVTSDGGVEKIMDVDGEDLDKRRSLKRTISEDGESGVAKKSKTESSDNSEEAVKPKEKLPLRTLLSLSNFMKSRKPNKRLSIQDLEEFCLQKICEVIVHKSDLGDVHHQLKLQEQLIETMRKEIQQLTKQARDLEIVNKKLMNDLKQQNATQKPLNPLKITRSVGLQVKFTPAYDASLKRRQQNPMLTTQKIQVQATSNRGPRNIPNGVNPSGVTRQATSPQKQPQQLPKPNTPLLSQALQNRRSAEPNAVNKTTSQAIRPKVPDPKSGNPSASVIDLTDEDDKKDKNKTNSPKMITQKNITVPLRTPPMRVNATQGIRLTTSQGKVSPITSVVTSSTAPQVMYVVQSSPQNLTSPLGPKAVVVNFQSANGVLSSALNGSAVSVIPKQSNTIQLKTLTPPKQIQNSKVIKMPNKHPAPLPPPPVVRVSLDKPLKPIPPKPHLTIRKTDTGIILQWKMPYELDMYEVIASYQLYAYQETSAMPSTDMWRKVGDVKALALPMACTLTQFADKNKYYFAVRPVDIHKRIGLFSEPEEISL